MITVMAHLLLLTNEQQWDEEEWQQIINDDVGLLTQYRFCDRESK